MSPPAILSPRAVPGVCVGDGASSGGWLVRYVYLELERSGSRGSIPFLVRSRFCFLLGCSSGIVVDGVGCLMMVDKSVERRFGVSVRGFSTGELFVVFSLCVGAPILCGFLVAGCAHAFSSLVGLDASDIATRGQRSFFYLFGGHGVVRSIGPPLRFADRLVGKSGWFSSPTASGGLLPLLGDSSSGVAGLLVIEAPDPLYTGDVIRLVRSAFTRHVGVPDVLLMVPMKIYDVLRRKSGRLHGQQLRPSATGMTGRNLQGLGCSLFYFKICLCKFWDVIYQKLM